MDEFDTPEIIPVRTEKEGPTLDDRISRAWHRLDEVMLAAGTPLAKPAQAWKTAADRRTAARSPESQAAVRDANKAYLAAMRDVRRDARAFEKARDEVKWWNVFNNERRAARSVMRDSKSLAAEARQARREARKAYPLTLPALAARCHAAHFVPIAFWDTVADSVMSTTAMWVSVAAVAMNVAVVKLGGRHIETPAAEPAPVVAEDVLRPSQEESDLMSRLEPAAWQAVAATRGLGDVVAAGVTLTESGIQAKLTLNGTMDLTALRSREAQLRAALQLREGTRLELREGKTGGQARLTLRTRSAADGVSLEGIHGPWGIDTVTGDSIAVPLGRRMLVAGTSGSGKSWSVRPILHEASEHADHRLVVLDMKRVEARLWKKRARIAIKPQEILDVVEELVAEMFDRLDKIPDGEDVVKIGPGLPRITVFVDEGSELISAAKKKEYADIMEGLRTLARMGRAAEIVLVWATQKPMLSGESPGLDSQISAQITCRLSLSVSTQKEAMVIFGDDAISEGWLAHKLPMPGVAMLRDSNTAQPHHLRMRALSPKDVMSLPDRPVWSRRVSSTGTTAMDIAARKAAEAPTLAGDPWQVDADDTATVVMVKRRVSAADRDDQIMEELRADPCRSLSSIAKAIGASKSVVSARLGQMEADGLIRKDEEDCWHPVD